MSADTSLPRTDPDAPWRTKAEAARHVRVSERHLQRLVARGDLVAYRRGRLLRFHVDDLDAYMRSGSTAA